MPGGVVDLRLASELGLSRGVVHRFLGGAPGGVPERYAAASPAERLPLGVPVLLTHGGRDDIVPPRDERALRGRGARCGRRRRRWSSSPARTTSATSTRRPAVAGGDRVDPLSRAAAAAADAADPLAGYRDRFVDADERIYLDGNSLGRLPVAHARAARRDDGGMGRAAGRRLAGLDRRPGPRRRRDRAGLIGAGPARCVACDSTTVNLFKLVAAALARRGGGALVTDRGNFPTDRYVLEGIAAQRGLELRLFDGEPDAATLPCGPRRRRRPLARRLPHRRARRPRRAAGRGARPRGDAVWDLSHSAGAVPVDLHAAGAELAVGCTYKYLNAGPGAPGVPLRRRARCSTALRSPIWGWFGQRDQFAMERGYDPEPSIRRFLAGTPPVLGLAAVEEGARLTAEAGIAALHAQGDRAHRADRRPARRLAGAARLLARHAARPGGARLARRAAHPEAWQITRALVERAGRRPRLPRPGRRAARRRAALHPPRRRVGRAGAVARPRRARRARDRRPPTRPRHMSGDLARYHFGLDAEPRPLPGELDRNYALDGHVLKLHAAGTDAAWLDLQDAAMGHVAGRTGEVATPRLRPARTERRGWRPGTGWPAC